MVKKIMYATIVLFVTIMLLVIVAAIRNPVQTVKYENGIVVEEHK